MQEQHLSADTRAIIAVLHETETRRDARIDSIIEAQRKLQSDVSSISKGFPDGDPDSHRRYHESVIEWRELRNKMVREALVNAAKVGGIAGLGWLGYAMWTAFKMEVMR